jgi:hypothetical protein
MSRQNPAHYSPARRRYHLGEQAKRRPAERHDDHAVVAAADHVARAHLGSTARERGLGLDHLDPTGIIVRRASWTGSSCADDRTKTRSSSAVEMISASKLTDARTSKTATVASTAIRRAVAGPHGRAPMELDVERACLASPVANSQDPVGMAQRMMALSVPSPLPATISGWSSFSASAIANSGVTGSGVQV